MKKYLLFALICIIPLLSFSQITYEDFESGGALTWQGLSGTYDGIVANPDPTPINMSDFCGSFTKDGAMEWSLALADLGTALDLSANNEFHISIYSPVATQVLFKLEGTGGAIEVWQNIANVNLWQEYTFDMSAEAANMGLTKIAVFFNPGQLDDGDTYLFDNIWAGPAGPCAGTLADADIIDDFECQRNATYGAGWDVLQAVANPDPSGINTSATVGHYEDPEGPWTALVMDYNASLDLTTKNNISVKIWSSKAVQILFKLEGGISAPVEIWQDITETDTWVEYTADFSAQENANHKKIVIFFNAGVEPEPGDLYYIDDISFAEAPPAPAIEDFEPMAHLFWEPLNGDMNNHGTFNGVEANPDQTGINDSPNVGRYTKGNAAFSTLTAFLPAGIDLSAHPQLNLQVRSDNTGSVTLQLVSATQGNKDVTRDIDIAGDWNQLAFNFEDFSNITDFERVNLLFDSGEASPGTSYLFDNLVPGISTIDPCENVTPNANIYDDYECQRNVGYGNSADRISVVDNPDVSAGNPSLAVGEYKDVIDEWSALSFETGSNLDLSLLNQFHIKIRSAQAVPLLFKLEGGTSLEHEVSMDVIAIDEWIEYVVDFSDQEAADHGKIAVFFNAGQTPAAEDIYYVDDVFWSRSGYFGCIDDHETENTTIANFSYFANGHLEAEGKTFEIHDNPNPSGINTSQKVGEFVKASDGEPWAGMFGDLDAPIDFGTNKTAKAKVLMDHIGNFAIKLEGSATGADPIELPVENTLVDEWEELTFDFSSVPDDAQFMRITLFFDLLIDATGTDVTSYFDDIVIGDGQCGISDGLFQPIQVAQFKIAPNPVHDLLFVENIEGISQMKIFNLLGQTVKTIQFSNVENQTIDLSNYENGMYLLAGYNKNGDLIANTKFIKK